MTFNLLIAGVGGQNASLASRLIAAAAFRKGYDVRTAETIGEEQRGCSVLVHCRIGDNIFSPLIPHGKADAILAFEPAEAVRHLHYLSKNGVVVTCNTEIKPSGIYDSYDKKAIMDFLQTHAYKLIMLDGRRLTAKDEKILNTALLGAAAQSKIFPFDADTIKDILPEILPENIQEINIKAFEFGMEICP